MVQNLTYTQYGDYYITDIGLAHMGILIILIIVILILSYPFRLWRFDIS